MSPIIDSHTHLGYDIGGGYSQSKEQLLEKLKKAKVDLAVACSFAYPGQDIRKSNDFIAKSQGKHIVGFGTIYPRSDEAPAEVERCVQKLGLAGLMVDVEASCLVGATWGPMTELPVINSFFQAAAKSGVPVLFHMRNPFSIWPTPGLAHFLWRMARRHPSMPIITNTLLPGVSAALESPNVYIETEYSGMPIDFERYTKLTGTGRILFASNAPIEHPYVMRKIVERSTLTEEEKDQVLSQNMRKLLKL
jgi:predicted TIM-barrel fold metal-dependent hydrolase